MTLPRTVWLAPTLTLLLAGLAMLPARAASEPAPLKPAVPCESLRGLSFYNIVITGATVVPATAGVPAHCRVSATERGTEHELELRLPDAWRERYVQRGGGGFDGVIVPLGATSPALSAGAAQGANNGGHRDPTGADLRNNPRALERYAHGAILTATRFGKAVTEAYYGRPARHTYYEGCSNGGRGALNAAAKFGAEFDGVIAAAPTLNLSGQIAAWTRAAALDLPSAAQFSQIHAAAVAKCDALDGAKDGVISAWHRCSFDPATDVPAAVGLTASQVNAVRALMGELRATDGQVIYSGYGLGDLGLGAPAFAMFGTGHFRYVIENDPAWSPAGFEPLAALPRIRSVIDAQYQFSAAPADLVQYMKRGGRIMIWHGSDDALISHRDTIRTWGDVTAAAGPELAERSTRLYIAPGVAHCRGGPGADDIDMLTPMINWVEHGRAPDTLLATKRDRKSGATLFTRPLCRYPGYPRYGGKGDVNAASSYACVAD
jgi:Tannase and feruloyl esterase